MSKIILASQSPRRKELLKQIGVQFICMPSELDEIITKVNPEDVVKELSFQKANDIASKIDYSAIIIGADTIVALEDKILGKPINENNAKQMLQSLQGRMHQVYTGITVIIKNEQSIDNIIFAEQTNVYMYPMSESQIEDYVATGEPLDKAGAYGIQGIFAKYIQKIEGDYNNVVGLPIARLYQELLKKGVVIG